jgi:hypothetical protein
MADEIAISGLPAVVTAASSDVFPVVQSGTTKKETSAQFISGNNLVSSSSTSTDNQIARFDGATGRVIKNSLTTIDDNGKLATDTINVASTSATAGGIQFSSVNFISNRGTNNTFCGSNAGNVTLTTGSAVNNAGYGTSTLSSLTLGSGNSGFGSQSLDALTTGSNNTAVGRASLNVLLTGSNNIAIGLSAGGNYSSSESSNLCIGNTGTTGESNKIRIGTTGTQDACYIAGIMGVSITAAQREIALIDNTNGQLGSIAILTSANGGTGNGFTKFAGATTSEKTYTLPDVSDTIACLAQSNTFTKAQGVTPVTLTSTSNSVATDASLSNNFKHTLTENTTLANPTNMVNGFFYQWRFVQDSTPRTLAFGNKFKFPGGISMLISTASGAVDILSGYYDSASDTIDCTYNQGFA